MFKKVLSTTLLIFCFNAFMPISTLAFDYQDNDVEHLQPVVKNAKIDLVKITSGGNIIQK